MPAGQIFNGGIDAVGASYLHLPPESELPDIHDLSPSRIIVIAEVEVSPEWQSAVSDWMVHQAVST
jgi:hypothetical protein